MSRSSRRWHLREPHVRRPHPHQSRHRAGQGIRRARIGGVEKPVINRTIRQTDKAPKKGAAGNSHTWMQNRN